MSDDATMIDQHLVLFLTRDQHASPDAVSLLAQQHRVPDGVEPTITAHGALLNRRWRYEWRWAALTEGAES